MNRYPAGFKITKARCALAPPTWGRDFQLRRMAVTWQSLAVAQHGSVLRVTKVKKT
jgi:hypothetical protein